MVCNDGCVLECDHSIEGAGLGVWYGCDPVLCTVWSPPTRVDKYLCTVCVLR